ncbi:hypothetical protein TNCT_7351 [Trichonephila clavata]|uniref:Uncharacterized protein n=1 Tax=Trichonephila clavata TaxID=2740835 RepID=A0A8X6GPS1_TRICU|nr:hypothetical protein TNCT_7351 [Trichonephila clavata]
MLEIVFVKKARGCHPLEVCWWSAAPTAVSDAYTTMASDASAEGWYKTVASARSFLQFSNAAADSSAHKIEV